MTQESLDFVYRFVPGDRSPALLALHGTGGDEADLLPLAAHVAPGAAVLSPRGRVLEQGMARFFRRVSPGVFDEEDLIARAAELSAWVEGARRHHGLADRPLIGLGFSNGANMAAALLLCHPGVLAGAVLLSPMPPLRQPPAVGLAGVRVFIGAGRRDPMAPPAMVERLRDQLTERGAVVEVHWHDRGHELTPGEVEGAAAWVRAGWPAAGD